MRESPAERVAFECVAAQVFGKIGKPSYLLAQQEPGDGVLFAGFLSLVFQMGKRSLHMAETKPCGECVVYPAFRLIR